MGWLSTGHSRGDNGLHGRLFHSGTDGSNPSYSIGESCANQTWSLADTLSSRPGRPYLDAIQYTVMSTPATAILAFAAGKFDRTWQGIMSIPLMKQLKDQEPNAECTVVPWNIPRLILVDRHACRAGDHRHPQEALPRRSVW